MQRIVRAKAGDTYRITPKASAPQSQRQEHHAGQAGCAPQQREQRNAPQPQRRMHQIRRQPQGKSGGDDGDSQGNGGAFQRFAQLAKITDVDIGIEPPAF